MKPAKATPPSGEDCPTDWKRRYFSRDEAKGALKKMKACGEHVEDMSTYKCVCGYHHVGHKLGLTREGHRKLHNN